MTYRIRTISGINPRPIKQEANRLNGFALTFAESVHEFGEGCGAFDFEEHFVVVIGHLDVEVLGFGLVFWIASGAGGLVTVGHFAF